MNNVGYPQKGRTFNGEYYAKSLDWVFEKKQSSPIQCKTGLRIAPASGGKSFGRMDKNFGETLDDAFGAQRTLHWEIIVDKPSFH